MSQRKKCVQSGIIFLAVLFIGISGNVFASTLVPQTWLPGDSLFPVIGFTQPLPVFGPGYNATLPRVDAAGHSFITVTMKEIEQQVLPAPYGKTRVWAYEIMDSLTGKILGPAHWPGVTVENQRNKPTQVKYVNRIPSFNASNGLGPPFTDGLVQGLLSMDQTLHWANPLGNTGFDQCKNTDCTVTPNDQCCRPHTGPVPTVPHLHGAEIISFFDGGPDAWFTSTGLTGSSFSTIGHAEPGEAIYLYSNNQEPGTLWFHDHSLGLTRTNVLSGLEAFYFIRDSSAEPDNLPGGAYEIELAVQDRQFDTNGQLFFPDGSPNGNPASPVAACGDGTASDPCLNGSPPNPDIHPFAVPEFFGDVAIVNGAPWPVLEVEPRRYLFRILDGSNARMYRLGFVNADPTKPGAPVYEVGADDNYLDVPALVYDPSTPLDQFQLPFTGFANNPGIFIAPAERMYVIVDFTNLAGQTITVTNDAPAPFPTGGLIPGSPGQLGMAQIMQFKVTAKLQGSDTSCNPAAGGCTRRTSIPRLTDGNGGKGTGVKIDKIRQLVLKEHEGQGGSGGPVDVFINNTRYDGLMSPRIQRVFPSNGVSELPQVGSTELWEIVNLTADAHPIHTHLIQFQLMNRQHISGDWDNLVGGYYDAWGAAFGFPNNLPADCVDPNGSTIDQANLQNPCPGYGPPLPYNVPNADGALGGNPPLEKGTTNYLLDPNTGQEYSKVLPNPGDLGWKDTIKAYPGMVTRILVRWAPSKAAVSEAKAGQNLYSFDPSDGPGYFVHCHIVDHEDNDMMRKYKVTTPSPQLYSPADNEIVTGPTVSLQWIASAGTGTYHVYNCEDQYMTGCTPVDVPFGDTATSASAGASPLAKAGGFGAGFILAGFAIVGGVTSRKKIFFVIAVLLISGSAVTACKKKSSETPPAPAGLTARAVTNLQPGTTYYWKVVADAGNGVTTESVTRSFTTQ